MNERITVETSYRFFHNHKADLIRMIRTALDLGLLEAKLLVEFNRYDTRVEITDVVTKYDLYTDSGNHEVAAGIVMEFIDSRFWEIPDKLDEAYRTTRSKVAQHNFASLAFCLKYGIPLDELQDVINRAPQLLNTPPETQEEH